MLSDSKNNQADETMADISARIRRDVSRDLEATIADRVQKEMDARRAELERHVQLARGTSDVTEHAQRAAPPVVLDLPTRIEHALRAKILDLPTLARTLGEPVGKVSTALRPLRGRLYNVGTAESPAWTWKIGDETPTAELTALVRRLIMHMPMTTAELVEATGARAGRVGGAIVEIQRACAAADAPERVYDLNNNRHRRRWFLMPRHVRDASLPAKGDRR